MVDVNLLNADVCKGSSKEKCACPVVLREGRKGSTVSENHETLHYEDRSQPCAVAGFSNLAIPPPIPNTR